MELKTIENAAFFLHPESNYPLCRVDLNGREAILAPVQKFLIFNAVQIYEGFDEFVYIIVQLPDGEQINPLPMKNIIVDTRLARLARKYIEEMDRERFRTGPVEIPPA